MAYAAASSSSAAGSGGDTLADIVGLPRGANDHLDAELFAFEDLDGLREGVLGSGRLDDLIDEAKSLDGGAEAAAIAIDKVLSTAALAPGVAEAVGSTADGRLLHAAQTDVAVADRTRSDQRGSAGDRDHGIADLPETLAKAVGPVVGSVGEVLGQAGDALSEVADAVLDGFELMAKDFRIVVGGATGPTLHAVKMAYASTFGRIIEALDVAAVDAPAGPTVALARSSTGDTPGPAGAAAAAAAEADRAAISLEAVKKVFANTLGRLNEALDVSALVDETLAPPVELAQAAVGRAGEAQRRPSVDPQAELAAIDAMAPGQAITAAVDGLGGAFATILRAEPSGGLIADMRVLERDVLDREGGGAGLRQPDGITAERLAVLADLQIDHHAGFGLFG